MNSLKQAILSFVREEEGLTIVEYAVAGALISVLVVTAFTNLGNAVIATINELIDAVNGP